MLDKVLEIAAPFLFIGIVTAVTVLLFYGLIQTCMRGVRPTGGQEGRPSPPGGRPTHPPQPSADPPERDFILNRLARIERTLSERPEEGEFLPPAVGFGNLDQRPLEWRIEEVKQAVEDLRQTVLWLVDELKRERL